MNTASQLVGRSSAAPATRASWSHERCTASLIPVTIPGMVGSQDTTLWPKRESAKCDRLRLTADGHLRTCLFSIDEWDLRGPMRAGATDYQLAAIVQDAVAHKELKHKINEGPAFQRASRSMSQIGG